MSHLKKFADSLKNRPNEICNECGKSVAWGSGLFVNRVPDLNDVDVRKAMGKPYPQGNYLCRNCDAHGNCELCGRLIEASEEDPEVQLPDGTILCQECDKKSKAEEANRVQRAEQDWERSLGIR